MESQYHLRSDSRESEKSTADVRDAPITVSPPGTSLISVNSVTSGKSSHFWAQFPHL